MDMSNAISVRLDAEALKALNQLESTGLTQSEAIRTALMVAVENLRLKENLADEVRRLELDDDDVAEMKLVAEIMDDLSA